MVPHDTPSESTSAGTPRRRFIDWLVGTSLGSLIIAIAYPAGRYLIPPAAGESSASNVTLPFSPDDIEPDSGRIFKFGSEPGIIVRTPAGELRAFSAVCTHLGCIVQYRSDLDHIWCACHNGHYDLNGINIAGPPPRPLERYTINTRGDQIVVSKTG